MIYIGINPDLVKSGPFTLGWHGLLSVMGGALAIWLAFRLASRLKVDKTQLSEILLWGIIGWLVGSRLVHVIDYWDLYSNHPVAMVISPVR